MPIVHEARQTGHDYIGLLLCRGIFSIVFFFEGFSARSPSESRAAIQPRPVCVWRDTRHTITVDRRFLVQKLGWRVRRHASA